MRKRPDYGGASPEDVARALMTEHQKKARWGQSDSGKSGDDGPDSELPSASESEYPSPEDCDAPRTPEHSGQDA